MEKRGLLSSRLVPPQPNERGRERRYFQIEPAAVAQLQEAKRALVRLWHELEGLDEA